MAGFRYLTVEEKAGVTVVHFRDHQNFSEQFLDQLGEELYCVADADQCNRLLISFSGVGFLSSAAIGKLVMVRKRLNARGGEVKLCDLIPHIQDLFMLTNLNSLFDICPDESRAMTAFAEGTGKKTPPVRPWRSSLAPDAAET
jgi:anti-anti-sigma factor